VLEKNEKAGKKIYITGKGRCNFTNLCDTEDFFSNVPRSASFLYSSVYGFDAHAVRDWFEEHGVRTKEERGQRAFPLSDHASDITRCLVREMERLGVEVWLNTEVKEILFSSSPPEGAAEDMPHGSGKKVVEGVLLADGRKLFSGCVIIATGGLSYPSTGSTGDGYRFARAAGHEVSRLSPSLVPFEVKEKDVIDMQGLSLKNVTFTVAGKKKNLFHEMGELMFTHFGITGPLILKASALVQEEIAQGALPAWIDLKPALTEPKLDARILRDFEENRNRSAQNAVRGLYPSKLIPVILKRAGIDPDTPVHDVTAAARRSLVQATKRFDLTLTCLRGFNEAVITRGGVNVRQVDPGTMESKLVKGLYFAGEVLDVDAFTGGFNLQIAWSTGRAAGDAGGTEYGI
jgi:predicted Rossmann fold flavoprotein